MLGVYSGKGGSAMTIREIEALAKEMGLTAFMSARGF